MNRYFKIGLALIFKPLTLNYNPVHFQLEPTTHCNLKCIMCLRIGRDMELTHMSFPNFRKIIDIIKPKEIVLSGIGEPTLNPDLPDMIKFAKDNSCKVAVITNFTLSDEKIEELFKTNLDLIKISIDAASPQTYKEIRGIDNLDRIKEGIKNINELKRENRSKTPFIRLQFLILNKNLHEILDFLRMAKEVEAETVYFQTMTTVGYTEETEDRPDKLVGGLSTEEVLKNLQDAGRLAKKLKINTNLNFLTRNFKQTWHKYRKIKIEDKSKFTCLLPWFSIYITVDGDITPCCSYNLGRDLIMGNIFKDDFDKIWNGKKYKEFRKLIKDGSYPSKTCKDCVPLSFIDFLNIRKIVPGFFRW